MTESDVIMRMTQAVEHYQRKEEEAVEEKKGKRKRK
jgi:hypothetical protein